MDIFELVSFYERRTNFREIDFFCSALTHLAVLVTTTFSNLFDTGVIETLVIAGFIILHLSIEY